MLYILIYDSTEFDYKQGFKKQNTVKPSNTHRYNKSFIFLFTHTHICLYLYPHTYMCACLCLIHLYITEEQRSFTNHSITIASVIFSAIPSISFMCLYYFCGHICLVSRYAFRKSSHYFSRIHLIFFSA